VTTCPYGFRIVGPTSEPRRLVDAGAAFAAHAACDQRAECHREAYLSAFQFGPDFRQHLESTGSTAGFQGVCWSPWVWFDVDAEDLARAHREAARLGIALYERYKPADDDLLAFFSGAKGFHVGLPTALWSPAPSETFHKAVRRFAEHVAERAGVTIDTGVYDKVRAFRAPNSRHPKTNLHKRCFTLDELSGLSLARIVELSHEPAPFDLPEPKVFSDQAAADWQAAVEQVAKEAKAKAARRAGTGGEPTLNRGTLDFIREGAGIGDRHRLLFSAAANLAEFSCPLALAFALLEPAGLDSGLAPKEVRRQIECGLAAVPSPLPSVSTTADGAPSAATVASRGQAPAGPPPKLAADPLGDVPAAPDKTSPAGADELRRQLAALWGSTAPPQAKPAADVPRHSPGDQRAKGLAALPPDPPPLKPLPPRALQTGRLDTPCRCGSLEYVDVAISEGRIRRDCRQCDRFIGWTKWYDKGETT